MTPTRLLAAAWLLAAVTAAPADEGGWKNLTAGPKPLENFAGKTDDWSLAAGAEMDSAKPRGALLFKPGEGVLVNSPKGHGRDLVTKEKFTDVEVHAEFLIPQRANAGIKLMGLYEIQILDTFGKKDLTGDSLGGIYPRAEDKPKYRHIDKGVPPKVNAAKPAGEWQALDITFVAPRFDADGKKTANAKFVKVTLNGQVVHENVEVEYPTGAAWRLRKEVAEGPLLLQGDHGPVAFRELKVRPYKP